jgi:hypothetical protein
MFTPTPKLTELCTHNITEIEDKNINDIFALTRRKRTENIHKLMRPQMYL